MTSWHNYGSIYSLGHKAIDDLLLDPVVVEEKIDGSQLSFGVFETPDGRVLRCKSKGADLNLVAPDKLFSRAVEYVKSIEALLTPGWTYRAEYLMRPKHNTLAYDRVPANHLIIFDIADGEESYLGYTVKQDEAARLGLETVPLLVYGRITDPQQFRGMLEHTSVLGGQKIEGVVIKNYNRYGPDKKVLMGKFVSETFKEAHKTEWRAMNPTRQDVISRLIEELKTPARWDKAVIHLRERGLIEDAPRDLGHLMKEVPADIEKEEIEYIKTKLFEHAWPQIKRGVIAGLPQWYKEKLMERQFLQEEAER